eukprot:c11743_g1_i1.p1 GENE.c11743_g1_i1~~c11743_g1_i1.p1  ORF type:complete len:202 (+),score=46.98 c11743_g1_i1:35-607(+)
MELEEGDMATLMAEISLESPIQNGNHRASPFETNFNSSLRDNDATPTIEIPSSPSIGPATQRVGGFVNVSEMRKHLLTTPSGLSDDTNNSEESADPVFARPSPLSTPSPIHMGFFRIAEDDSDVPARCSPTFVKPLIVQPHKPTEETSEPTDVFPVLKDEKPNPTKPGFRLRKSSHSAFTPKARVGDEID